jgi:DNA-binding FadR family transcriptional regulator
MYKRKARARGKRGETPSNRLHLKLAQSIAEQILSGFYAPGTLLPNEAQWCDIYGASRTAVREAIKGLNAKGLLVSRPKVGSRVEPRERWNLLDRDVLAWYFAVADKRELLISIQEVRKVFEPEVAALAAQKRRPAQIEDIRTAFEGMENAKGPGEAVEPDVRFHLAVLQATNNELLAPFGVVIESALRNLFDFTTATRYEPELVLPLHRNILKSIEKGDPNAARRATKVLLADTDSVIENRSILARRMAIKPNTIRAARIGQL